LRQIASTTATLDDNTDHSSKLDATVDLILENTGKIVVFFQFRKSVFALCRRLDKLGIKYIQAVGGMKEDVSDLAAQFQEDDSKVFIATLDTGGEGLTLTKASTIVFGEKHWNPAKQKQAEDRVHRISQTNPVTVISLHCTGTVDDIVESVVQRKMSVYSAIINEEIVSHIRAHGGLKHARIGDRSHTAIN
jgi:SWI/SNF-related matrix-associated actin-dependent regulator 1 of chromatin subfamily A